MDNKHTTFGLSRKNPGTWIAAALMLAGVILLIVYYCSGGANGLVYWAKFEHVFDSSPSVTGVNGWWVLLSIVLPCLGGVLFVIRLIINGRDRLYKTGFSVLLLTAFFVSRAFWLHIYDSAFRYAWPLIVYAALLVSALVVWDLTVNGARIKSIFPAAILYSALLLAGVLWRFVPSYHAARFAAENAIPAVSSWLFLGSLCTAAFSLQRITSEKYRPRRGDRPDGRLVRSLDPMNGVAIYIMPTRNGAATYFRDSVECSRMEEYIRRKRAEGLTGFGTLHVIAAAYVRVISQHPSCNRFVSGQRIFSRDGEIELAMAVKKDMKADAPETIIKVYFSPEDTADDVFRKYNEQIQEAKDTPLDSGFDNLAGLINVIPGLIKKFVIWFIRVLDYFGKLPRFLMKLSPFHGSVFVTALGSLGIPPVFHHLYDFGNIPAFIAFGARRTVTELGDDGAPVRRKYVDYTIVTDERICDGFYYASAFKSFRRYLNNPEKLDVPPEKVEEDVF